MESEMNKKGFTLVEIMIVVAIIGLLAAIAIPSFMRARQSSQSTGCINNLRQIDAAKDQYAMEKGLTNGAFLGSGGADNDVEVFSNLVGGAAGFIKQWPLCPGSTTEPGAVATMAALCANDYDIGPMGTNPLCKILGGTNNAFPHLLPISQ